MLLRYAGKFEFTRLNGKIYIRMDTSALTRVQNEQFSRFVSEQGRGEWKKGKYI